MRKTWIRRLVYNEVIIMSTEELRERFLTWQSRLSAYRMALTLIEIDATERPLNAGAGYRGEKGAVLAGEYMRVLKEDGMEEVMEKFAKCGSWRLPVLDADGRYLGFISKSRVLEAYREALREISRD